MQLRKIKSFNCLYITLFLLPYPCIAGNTVDQFYKQPGRTNLNNNWITLNWGDASGNLFGLRQDINIYSGEESQFTLNKSLPDKFDQFKFDLLVSGSNSLATDIQTAPDVCDLGQKDLCKFSLTAANSINGTHVAQLNYIAKSGNSPFVAQRPIWINVLSKDSITATGPNQTPNKISLVLTSDASTNLDQVPVTFSIKSTGNTFQSAEIKISPKTATDTQIVKFAQTSCNLNADSSCKLLASPYTKGVATYQISGNWINNQGQSGQFENTEFKLAVADLYAGYQSSKIIKKGVLYNLPGAVTQIMYDALHQQLIATAGNSIQTLNDSEPSPVFNFFAKLNSSGDRIAFSDESETLIVAEELGTIDFYNRSTASRISQASLNNETSAMSLAINNNNLVYITDTDNNYYSAYGNKEGKHNPGIENLGHPFNENTYTNFLLIETASNLFAAVQGINTNLSTLFKWDYTSKSFVPLSYDNTSPFTNKEAISGIFTFPFTDDPEAVYVGGHSGFLYKLIPSQQSGKMHWVALNNGTPLGKKNTPSQIFDLVADPNGNLYSAAGKTGVWKIPTNSTSAVQIKGYDLPEYINTLVLAPPINKE